MNCILMMVISPVSPQEFTSTSATCPVLQSNTESWIFSQAGCFDGQPPIRCELPSSERNDDIWWYIHIDLFPEWYIYICICKSKRGFLNINNNTHTSSFSYKVALQDTFLWINVTLCQNFALADNAKASGCCNSSRGHLKSLSLLLTFKSDAKALLC